MILAEKGQKRVWLERIFYAIMIAVLTISLLVAAVPVYRAYFNDPPVHVVSLDKSPTSPVCPGAAMDIHSRVTVDSPTLLLLYVSVMDEGQNFNIPDTAQYVGPRLHPHKATFTQYVAWTVPELAPGKYSRVFGVRGHDGDETPVFLLLPFEVAKDC